MKMESRLPHSEHEHRHRKQAQPIETAAEHKRHKHHNVIPVEYAAGRTAAVFHEEHAERTPEQYAYEIADIEKHAYEEYLRPPYHIEQHQSSYGGRDRRP
ncbi:hypothetical protein, partial [Corynebacterium stationis]|uniref:hypothetical protein n=1 Tax=Corynebacterium stationis TaxID=1705 RepID=UPI001CD53197